MKFKTDVLNPLKLKSKFLTLGIGNLNFFGFPFFEYLSIIGPAGYSNPIALPHLSKASPIASSSVVSYYHSF